MFGTSGRRCLSCESLWSKDLLMGTVGFEPTPTYLWGHQREFPITRELLSPTDVVPHHQSPRKEGKAG